MARVHHGALGHIPPFWLPAPLSDPANSTHESTPLVHVGPSPSHTVPPPIFLPNPCPWVLINLHSIASSLVQTHTSYHGSTVIGSSYCLESLLASCVPEEVEYFVGQERGNASPKREFPLLRI